MRVGVIGLGRIGLPQARKLAAAGHDLWLFDAQAAVLASACADLGAESARSPAHLAGQVEAVIVCVSGVEADWAVLAGEKGVFVGAHRGQLIGDLTTISVAQSVALAALAAAKGVDYLDAPVSVSQRPDVGGSLTIMVGGEQGAFARAKPLLDCLATRVHFVGPHGSGTALKLINQAIYVSYLAAFAEGLAKGEAAGIPLESMLAVLAPAAAGSPSIATKCDEIRGLSNARFAISHAVEFLALAECVVENAPEAPVFAAALGSLRTALANGVGEEDIVVARNRYLQPRRR
jgi:3-hydroxyisobutyrate dehydrogenase-like beta-hydroxyacid dehydrogenase